MAYMRDSTGKRLDNFEVPDKGLVFYARDAALYSYCHSYGDGQGASDRTKRFTSLIAEAWGLRDHNESISGTSWTGDASGASYSKVLQQLTRGGMGGISGSSGGVSGKRGYGAPQAVYLLMQGINDLNTRGNTAGGMALFRGDLRAGISRFRSTAVFENSDNTWSFGGTWSTPADALGSGTGYQMTTSNASTWAITTPADFPGGTVVIGFRAAAGAGVGATHTVTLNGSAAGSVNAFGVSGTQTAHVLRINDVPAGNNTINGVISGVVTSTGIDYWAHEAPTDEAPLVILIKQPYPVDYSLYGSTPPGPPTDAGVDVLNGIIEEIAAEYDERVIVVDTSPMSHDATLFMSGDNLHPSDKGHRRIAELVDDAVARAGFTIVPGGDIRQPRTYYATAVPIGSRTKYEIGDTVRNTVPTVLGSAGSQYAIVEWRCIVGGRPGTWVEVRGITGT